MIKVISACAARGNQRGRCKNGLKCARSAHFCSDLNETWYTGSPGHDTQMVFHDKSGLSRVARGNYRGGCKNGQRCARSTHFCIDLDETWYTGTPGHDAQIISFSKSNFFAGCVRKSASEVQKQTEMRA